MLRKGASTRVHDVTGVAKQLLDVQAPGKGCPRSRLLADYQRGAYTAVRVAAALQRSPIGSRSLDKVRGIGQGGCSREREPVPQRLKHAGLQLYVAREVRQRVTLTMACLVVDFLIAPGERDRLKGNETDLVAVGHGKLDDRPHLVLVDRVHDGGHQRHVDASLVQVLDGAQLHVEQVAYLPVRVRFLAHAVELQIRDPESGLPGPVRKRRILCEPDAVGCCLDTEVPDTLRVRDRVQEDG